MTLFDDDAAAKAANALQAAHFRASLCHERARLMGEIAKRRSDLDKRQSRGSIYALQRLGGNLRSVEAEVRQVDGLIARFDHRFASHWDERN